MRRALIACACSLLVVTSACGTEESGPASFTVGVDAASPEGKNLQYSAFFPSSVKVSPGDSVTFENASTQAPHTITFGVDEQRSNQPAVILPAGGENPVLLEPCFTEQAPTPELTTCPDKELPAYDGSGFWNSGFLVPAPAPDAAGPKKVTIKLADDIAAGQYRYLCVLHGPMVGVLEVVSDEGDRDSAEAVEAAGTVQLEKVRKAADGIADPTVGALKVAAGWGDQVTAANRFFPQTIDVNVGQTVTWDPLSSYEPHTVSFGEGYRAGAPAPEHFGPQGVKSGSGYPGGVANSGIFGAQGGPFPPGPFSLTFTTAGEYKYVCVLHPGMEGTVKVT